MISTDHTNLRFKWKDQRRSDFLELNYQNAAGEHLWKTYVDESVIDPSLKPPQLFD